MFELEDKLEVFEVNEPRPGFCPTCAGTERGPELVIDVIPDCPDGNTF